MGFTSIFMILIILFMFGSCESNKTMPKILCPRWDLLLYDDLYGNSHQSVEDSIINDIEVKQEPIECQNFNTAFDVQRANQQTCKKIIHKSSEKLAKAFCKQKPFKEQTYRFFDYLCNVIVKNESVEHTEDEGLANKTKVEDRFIKNESTSDIFHENTPCDDFKIEIKDEPFDNIHLPGLSMETQQTPENMIAQRDEQSVCPHTDKVKMRLTKVPPKKLSEKCLELKAQSKQKECEHAPSNANKRIFSDSMKAGPSKHSSGAKPKSKSMAECGSMEVQTPLRKLTRIFMCNMCSYKSDIRRYFKQHQLVHTAERQFSCELCCKSYRWKKDLNIHKGKYHKSFICCSCEDTFDNEFNLIKHSKKFLAKIPEYCAICQKSFNLKCHPLVHQDPKFICQICGVKYRLKRNLIDHTNFKHEGKKNYECKICHKVYPYRQSYAKHMNKHR